MALEVTCRARGSIHLGEGRRGHRAPGRAFRWVLDRGRTSDTHFWSYRVCWDLQTRGNPGSLRPSRW